MKAIAVLPGQKNSIHLRDVQEPEVGSIVDGTGIKMKTVFVGADGTDKEINDGLYGDVPEGDDYLILGHESFGQVVEVGQNVSRFKVGDFVTTSVRRPGFSDYDKIGRQDFTMDSSYYERGISRCHGYLTEYIVDREEFFVKVPEGIKDIAVLSEPMSVAEKGITQAYDVQNGRLPLWRPKTAAVIGSGTLGILAAMILKLRGLDVSLISHAKSLNFKSELLKDIDISYFSNAETSVMDISKSCGGYDLVFEATGFGPIVFEIMQSLKKNGVAILTGVPGSERESCNVAADKIMREFALGNRILLGSVNAHTSHFEQGVKDLTLAKAMFNNFPAKLLTHKVNGLENYQEMIQLLTTEKKAIKVYVQIG